MILAIDIGNTNIHVGVFYGDERAPRRDFCLGADDRRSSDEYALLIRALLSGRSEETAFDGVIIGSVVPMLTDTVLSAVKRLTDAPVTVVGPGVKTGFSIRLSDPSELGADLAANTAGAIAAFGAPCIVVDFGTATVVSAVDRDKSFPGASILPGVRMSFDALGETGLLPDVPAGASASPKAELPAIGKSTPDAMRSGVTRGQIFAVTGLCELYKKTLGLPDSTPIVVSGGYAAGMLSLLPKEYVHVPHLTLRGLAEIYRLNAKRK